MRLEAVIAPTLGILLAFLTAAAASAESTCLKVAADGEPAYFVIAPGDKLSLQFLHSIYGSVVEEEFHLDRTGFRSSRLSYGEPRLVEFYGHESSREENGRWVVDYGGLDLTFVDVHVSSDAAVRVLFRDHVLFFGDSIDDVQVRLSVTVCPVNKDG